MNALGLTPQFGRRFNKSCSRSSVSSVNVTSIADKAFEFLEPKTLSKGTFGRKRSVCDDNISVLSFSGENDTKPFKKRRLSRMNSLAVFLSPAKQIRKVGGMITRAKSAINLPDLGSFDGGELASPSLRSNSLRSSIRQREDGTFSPHKKDESPRETPGLSRNRHGSSRKKASHESMKRGRSWIEKFTEDKRPLIAAEMSYWELKRQEAIYELYKGEKYLVKDLEMVVKAYKKSLICLKILQENEAEEIFGPIDTLLPLHKDLKAEIKAARNSSTKTVFAVGEILHNWAKRLESVYIPYLSNQAHAKQMLDSKKANCKDLKIFLDLCIQSDFSRRLDLWNFLDVPRSKLMKYPLLLKSILKQTPEGHGDKDFLPEAIVKIEEVIKSVDMRTGEANCKYLLQKLQFSDERQKEPFLYLAKTILCQGELKNNRGTKLYGFLFDTGFLLTRIIDDSSNASSIRYKAHKQPISAHNLVTQEVKEGENRSGSFKSTFSFSSSGKNVFQVSSKMESECYVLSASSEHDKQEWLQRLKEVIAASQPVEPEIPLYETLEEEPEVLVSTPIRQDLNKDINQTTPKNNSEQDTCTPKTGGIKKGFGSCKSLLQQKSKKSLDQSLEGISLSSKRRRLSDAKKLLKEAQNFSPGFKESKK